MCGALLLGGRPAFTYFQRPNAQVIYRPVTAAAR